jgi:NADH dehydrogenase FAD-containing subunit
MPAKGQKKRVLVVGAGAAGMSCADALARHPDRFEVTLIGE